jgi:hypothetical protein
MATPGKRKDKKDQATKQGRDEVAQPKPSSLMERLKQMGSKDSGKTLQ